MNTINEFLADSKPLIMSYGCGSFSLNMQECSEIVFSSLTFDYGLVEQAKARIRRIGQRNDIRYTYFLTDCGINRMILDNLSKKKNLDELVKMKLDKGDMEWLKNI
jgi:SNF2 family DNA or RNA helicase